MSRLSVLGVVVMEDEDQEDEVEDERRDNRREEGEEVCLVAFADRGARPGAEVVVVLDEDLALLAVDGAGGAKGVRVLGIRPIVLDFGKISREDARIRKRRTKE